MSEMCWAMLTGEYPPDPGGVSDYTHRIAIELVKCGDEVHIFAPPVRARAAEAVNDSGVIVHRLPDSFGPMGLAQVRRALDALPATTRILVQYVPHAFGYRAMNVGLCLWLAVQRDRPIDVMFHEVASPIAAGQPLKHSFLGLVHRAMALVLVRAASRILVSTTAWDPLLRPLKPASKEIELLPLPTNMPTIAIAPSMTAVQSQYASDVNSILVGHFGTFVANITPTLSGSLRAVLAVDGRIRMLLIGRGGEQFVESFRRQNPEDASRISAVFGLAAQAVVDHLGACDVLVQPYPDGLTTRRTSFMAGLALGIASVSTRGPSTETIWESSGAVLLADNDPDAIARAVKSLVDDPDRRRALARRGRQFYFEHFDIDKVVAKLRSIPAA